MTPTPPRTKETSLSERCGVFSFSYRPSGTTFSPLTPNKPLRRLTNQDTAPLIGSTRGSVAALDFEVSFIRVL